MATHDVLAISRGRLPNPLSCLHRFSQRQIQILVFFEVRFQYVAVLPGWFSAMNITEQA